MRKQKQTVWWWRGVIKFRAKVRVAWVCPYGSQTSLFKSCAKWPHAASLSKGSRGLRLERLRYKPQPLNPLALWTVLPPAAAAAAAKSLQSCPTLCDPIDGSPPGSPVPGILQTRTLEWVAIAFSNAWKWKVKGKSLSHARLLATPWTAAPQAPLSMGFSRQEYWSGLPLPSPTT